MLGAELMATTRGSNQLDRSPVVSERKLVAVCARNHETAAVRNPRSCYDMRTRSKFTAIRGQEFLLGFNESDCEFETAVTFEYECRNSLSACLKISVSEFFAVCRFRRWAKIAANRL